MERTPRTQALGAPRRPAASRTWQGSPGGFRWIQVDWEPDQLGGENGRSFLVGGLVAMNFIFSH